LTGRYPVVNQTRSNVSSVSRKDRRDVLSEGVAVHSCSCHFKLGKSRTLTSGKTRADRYTIVGADDVGDRDGVADTE
jgi:hypothetical protein